MSLVLLKQKSVIFKKNDNDFYKNDTDLMWKSKKIVDNFVETGDFSKIHVHTCHF